MQAKKKERLKNYNYMQMKDIILFNKIWISAGPTLALPAAGTGFMARDPDMDNQNKMDGCMN